MKSVIDALPAPLFLAALFLKDIYWATATLMLSLSLVAAWHWWRDGRPHKLHTLAAVAVLVLGGLTLLLRDASFVKYKTTVVNGLIAAALLLSHVIGDKVLMARIPQKTVVLPDAVWARVNLAWSGFFAGVALLNLYAMQVLDDRAWGLFKTFGVSALMFVFLLAHLPFIGKYLREDGKA